MFEFENGMIVASYKYSRTVIINMIVKLVEVFHKNI